MADCLTELAGRMGRREIVMIFSDFFTDLDALEPVLQRLRYNQHEVVLFQVMHHDELAFEFDGMVKFVGLEIPEELLAQPDDLRRAYLAGRADDSTTASRKSPSATAASGCWSTRAGHGRAVYRLSEPAEPAEPGAVNSDSSVPLVHARE